jgi:hypothetical protein
MKEPFEVLGGLILLFSWLSQTFLFDRWRSRLAQIQEAHMEFITYQSNHGIYAVLSNVVPPEKREELQSLEIRDFRTGLNKLLEVLSDRQHEALDDKIEAQVENYAAQNPEEIAQIMAESTVIQTEFAEEKQRIKAKKSHAEKLFWVLYILGSVLILLGKMGFAPVLHL